VSETMFVESETAWLKEERNMGWLESSRKTPRVSAIFLFKNDSRIFFFSDTSSHHPRPHGFAHRILFSGRSCQEVALAKTEKAETKGLGRQGFILSPAALRAVTYLVSWRGTKIVGV
jgi:hypothetical protein